jgi:hypothetical protein
MSSEVAMSEYNVPEKFLSREVEFRAMTRKWIEKKHAGYAKSMKHLEGLAPLRHPPTAKDNDGFSLEHLWSDAIWCGDCTLDPLTEFFDLDMDDEVFENMGCGETADWANEIFNDEFKAVLPKLAHVLEG